MARNRQDQSIIEGNTLNDNRVMVDGRVVTGTTTLAAGGPNYVILSAAAPQTVKLPPIALGMQYWISAITSTITVQDSAAGAVGSVAAGKTSLFTAGVTPASGVLTWFIQAGA